MPRAALYELIVAQNIEVVMIQNPRDFMYQPLLVGAVYQQYMALKVIGLHNESLLLNYPMCLCCFGGSISAQWRSDDAYGKFSPKEQKHQ
jgi:hypothetical protein